MDVPSGRSGKLQSFPPAPLVEAREEPDAIELCWPLCFLMRVQPGGLLLTAGTGQNVLATKKCFLGGFSSVLKPGLATGVQKTLSLAAPSIYSYALHPTLYLSHLWFGTANLTAFTYSWSHPKCCRSSCPPWGRNCSVLAASGDLL